MLRFIGPRPKLYSFNYELEARFDLVKKPTDTSVMRIVLDNKNTGKG